MADRVRVVHDDEGRLVALKSPPPDDPERTRREAALLAAVEHPGVVTFLGLDERSAGGPELRTAWVGSRRAADLPRPLAPARAAGLVLAVGAIVADLHGMGIVHGALEAGHVVLDPYGRPVLCGMGAARRFEPVAPHAAADARPVTDVAGLGRLLRQLLGPPDPDEEPDAPPAVTPRRREDRRTAGQRRSLLAVAARAEDVDPDARPGLQAFLGSVRAAVPEAALGADPAPGAGPDVDPLVALLTAAGPSASSAPRSGASVPGAAPRVDPTRLGPATSSTDTADGPDHDGRDREAPTGSTGRTGPAGDAGSVVIDAPTVGAGLGPAAPPLAHDTAGQLFRDLARLRPDGPGHPRPPRGGWMRTAAALAALGLASFVGLSVLRSGGGAATVARPDRSAPSSTTPSGPPTTAAVAAAPDRTSPTTAPAPTGSAPVVEHAGRRFAVGEPGDLAAVADWSCDGRPRVVLYRPATGSLFVFTGWPDAGGSVETRAVTAVPGGTALATEPGPDGCPQLAVTGGGPEVAIDPELLR